MDLEALAPIIEEVVKQSLNTKAYEFGHPKKGTTKRVATGNLMNSIKAEVATDTLGVQFIQLTAFGKRLEDTYAYWLIYGRKAGSFPNVTAIREWIKNKKSLKIRDFKTGRFLPKDQKNIDRLAYVIGRSMKQYGFQNQPLNFIELSIETLMKDSRVEDIIGEATINELIDAIQGI